MNGMTRRDFLKLASRGLLAASGLFGVGMLVRLLGFQTEPPPQNEFNLGMAQDYPVGSRTLIAEVPALLIRSEAGFSALSLTCTHLGCTLEQEKDGFACPCHGSRFDAEGHVLRGPAVKTLVALRVEQNESGHIILNTKE